MLLIGHKWPSNVTEASYSTSSLDRRRMTARELADEIRLMLRSGDMI